LEKQTICFTVFALLDQFAGVVICRRVECGLAPGITERASVQFRWEVFNAFNRAQYGQPSGVLVAGQFGLITSTINTTPVGTGTPREMQFMLRATF
jgi:hypothetical protein